MTARLALNVALSAGLSAGLTLTAAAQTIPDHPDKLTFKPIRFEVPRASDYRVPLKNGILSFIGEDRTLPLVNISLLVRVGSYLEPPGKEGLAALTGSMIRRGGTRSLTAEQLDEKLDFLAAQASTGIGDTQGSAGLNGLADNLDESLRIFVEMLKEPRFQEDRLALAKDQMLQEMKKRNDDSADIEHREFHVLIYGERHFTNRFPTAASVASITRDDLVAFHRKWFHPASMVAAVAGAFDRAQITRKLEGAFAGWPGARPVVPPVPAEITTAAPGLYRIEKDVPQGRVSIGLPTVKRDDPDIYALEVMNEILGGSGFTSRITRTVRSNEGLAYAAGSGIRFGVYYPGLFRAAFQSKSRTVNYALQLVLDEIRKMREGKVTEEELDTIKKNLIETLPSTFASKAQTVTVFATDEFTGRDPSYWTRYRERIAAVTAADVQRVAQKHLDPAKLVILVVGNQKEIDIGDGKHAIKVEDLAPQRRVVVLPLRDPMTMKLP